MTPAELEPSENAILSHLAENPPQCAAKAIWEATEWDQLEAKAAFTAAINAIKEAK